MDDVTIAGLQKKADHFESQYNAIKKEFKDFIENTRKNEDLKRKDLQSDQAKKVLVIADSLCRMTSAVTNNSCDLVRSVHENYQLNIGGMYQQLLSSCGLTPIDPAPGTPFDDSVHMAVGLEYGSRYPENTVFSVIRRGYLREQNIIRPAEVIISKRPREPAPVRKPGLWTLVYRLFPSRQKFAFLDQQIDHLAHTGSETTTRLEAEIQSLREILSRHAEEKEDLEQIIADQAESLERLEEKIDQLKLELNESTEHIKEIAYRIPESGDRSLPFDDEMDRETGYPDTRDGRNDE